jgi:hypothetical protein
VESEPRGAVLWVRAGESAGWMQATVEETARTWMTISPERRKSETGLSALLPDPMVKTAEDPSDMPTMGHSTAASASSTCAPILEPQG